MINNIIQFWQNWRFLIKYDMGMTAAGIFIKKLKKMIWKHSNFERLDVFQQNTGIRAMCFFTAWTSFWQIIGIGAVGKKGIPLTFFAHYIVWFWHTACIILIAPLPSLTKFSSYIEGEKKCATGASSKKKQFFPKL